MSVETLSAKAEACRLFSILFYNPEDTFLAEPEVISDLSGLLIELGIDASGLIDSINNVDEGELMQDYAALFVGPYQLQAPPYGSVYLDKGRRLNDESTTAVLETYRIFGLDVDTSMKEPADHIAIELEFIYTALVTLENMKNDGEATSELEAVLVDFLSKLFNPFAVQMCDLMQKNATTDFYQSIGKQLRLFIEQI